MHFRSPQGKLSRTMRWRGFHRAFLGSMGFVAVKIALFVAVVTFVTACKKDPPLPVPITGSSQASQREVTQDSPLLFTYLEPTGVFATTDKAEKVPAATRRLVRIMGQANSAIKWRNDANVDVIDLSELLSKGKTLRDLQL